ncbi:MAG: alpha/beta hydrolase [Liquorilactobacillus ghanensis]|uniref:alpha/beta hydrolase n=1 Tax=Liquorilactobacillus ghanensis TaxID=399370 RepID=UPI0039EAC524
MLETIKKKFRIFPIIFGRNEYKLEYYPVKTKKKAPFAIICPGGGYTLVMMGTEGEDYARALNKRGYAAFVLKYRIRKKALFPAPLDDLARAIREVLENADRLHLDRNNYSIWGSSAGGHLAACFGTETIGFKHYQLPKPTALILCYPVVTMGEHAHKYSRAMILGKNPNSEQADLLSVEKNITPSYPPTFLWNSMADQEVEPINSKLLADALVEKDVKNKYISFKSGKHGIGLGLGTPCETWFDDALRFWKEAKGAN